MGLPPGPGAHPRGWDLQACFSAEQKSGGGPYHCSVSRFYHCLSPSSAKDEDKTPTRTSDVTKSGVEVLTSPYDFTEMHNQATGPDHHVLHGLNQLRVQGTEVDVDCALQEWAGQVGVPTREDGGEVHQRVRCRPARSVLRCVRKLVCKTEPSQKAAAKPQRKRPSEARSLRCKNDRNDGTVTE